MEEKVKEKKITYISLGIRPRDRALFEWLKEHSQETDIPVSSIIRKALRLYKDVAKSEE